MCIVHVHSVAGSGEVHLQGTNENKYKYTENDKYKYTFFSKCTSMHY